MAEENRFVYNHDVVGFHRRINRFIVELIHSVSSNVSQLSKFDINRMKSYIKAIREYQQWCTSQPQLDLPETAPMKFPLEADPVIPDVENESVADAINMLILAREELVNSQSARQASGLIGFDGERLKAIVDKLDAFLDSYVSSATPLDLPESSPQEPMVEAGLKGV